MKKIFPSLLIILSGTFVFCIPIFAQTTIYDDGSSRSTTIYDDGSSLTTTTDTDGKSTYSATPATDGNSSSPKGRVNTSQDTGNITGIEAGKLRQGDVDMNTIPKVIVSIIETLLGVAGTVAIFGLIYNAIKMQLKSGITGDSSGVDSAKKGMIASLVGFVLAILAWFLVTRLVELLGAIR